MRNGSGFNPNMDFMVGRNIGFYLLRESVGGGKEQQAKTHILRGDFGETRNDPNDLGANGT